MTTTNSFRRGITEAVLILASILIAFWIDAWWEDRQAMQLEADALSAVHVEVGVNLLQLERAKRTNELQLDAVDRFLKASPDELRSLSPDTVRIWIGSIMRPSVFDADRAAATVLATIPLSSARGSAEARRFVSRMQRQLERLERVSGGLGESYGAVRRQLAEYASQGAPNGRGDVPTMVAQVGPDILARLRADDEFIAAVIDKAHVQSIYLGALYQVEETLDLLTALPNPR